MPKALVTGINGFAGSHLNDYLLSSGYEVSGIVKPNGKKVDDNFFEVDIKNFIGIKEIIEKVKPDEIYHLAALASPAQSFKDPSLTITTNISGQLNILEAVRQLGYLDTKILVVSSAEIYGDAKHHDLPLSENSKLKPLSPYAVSKIAQDFLGYQYYHAHDIKTIIVRPFNTIGPNQLPMYVISSFAHQIAEIENGQKEAVMKVGNLESKRDFTDVRDMVRAYKLLMQKGNAGEVYNIGSGKSYSIKEVLEILLSLSNSKIVVEKDPSLFRPGDIPELRCDYDKLHKTTGWKPEISIEDSLKDTLDYWRNIL